MDSPISLCSNAYAPHASPVPSREDILAVLACSCLSLASERDCTEYGARTVAYPAAQGFLCNYGDARDLVEGTLHF